MTWHADRRLLAAYRNGTVDDAGAFSLEAHLLACSECRAAAGAHVDDDRLQRVWRGVEDAVAAPRPSFVEAALLRLGVPVDVARLLAATPSLTSAWLLAVALALGFAVLAARRGGSDGILVFLVIAPLLPVAGVAAAYSPALDPAHELAIASPLRSFKLLLVRAVAVVATTVGLAAMAAPALPGAGWAVVAWLLPALALSSMSLALSTYLGPVNAAATLVVAWTGTVVVSAVASGDHLAAFGTTAQGAIAAAGLLAAALVARRREFFEMRTAIR